MIWLLMVLIFVLGGLVGVGVAILWFCHNVRLWR